MMSGEAKGLHLVEVLSMVRKTGRRPVWPEQRGSDMTSPQDPSAKFILVYPKHTGIPLEHFKQGKGYDTIKFTFLKDHSELKNKENTLQGAREE